MEHDFYNGTMDSAPLTILRGATVTPRRTVRRRTWFLLLPLSLVVLAIANVWSVSSDVQRQQRLRQHGLTVTVHVGDCVGNLGGSGSTGAGYTCTGRYHVAGRDFSETIVGQSSFLAPGRSLIGIVDPNNNHFIVASSALDTLGASPVAYWPTAVSAAALLVVTWRFRRRRYGSIPSGVAAIN